MWRWYEITAAMIDSENKTLQLITHTHTHTQNTQNGRRHEVKQHRRCVYGERRENDIGFGSEYDRHSRGHVYYGRRVRSGGLGRGGGTMVTSSTRAHTHAGVTHTRTRRTHTHTRRRAQRTRDAVPIPPPRAETTRTACVPPRRHRRRRCRRCCCCCCRCCCRRHRCRRRWLTPSSPPPPQPQAVHVRRRCARVFRSRFSAARRGVGFTPRHSFAPLTSHHHLQRPCADAEVSERRPPRRHRRPSRNPVPDL